MLHVLLTVKPSTRYPGKNARLAGYTVAWLAMEMLHLSEPVRVYTVGQRAELPPCMPPAWPHFECATGSHRGDVEHAEKLIAPAPCDVMVLAQFTQPLRRPGLLADVARHARACGSAVTACRARQEDWRALNGQGAWCPVKGERAMLHDGALYAWQPGRVSSIFSALEPHGVAFNYDGFPVDIDEREDMPAALPAAFSEMLLRDYLCQP